MGTLTFILASASPARHRLLQTIGIAPIVCPSGFDESQVQVSEPEALVRTLAQCKAEETVRRLDRGDFAAKVLGQMSDRALVMGCDSVLVLDGEICGKAADAHAAIAAWQKMRGTGGQLYTGHALIDRLQQKKLVSCQVTQVYFANISDRQISAYVATGEPLNCAGSFAIEGRGGLFIEKLVGCHTNVIGLSLPMLRQMLADLGYNITEFWHA